MLTKTVDRLADTIENADALDGVAAALTKAGQRVLGSPLVRRLASGTPVGHPAHPALVAVPLGSWVAASYLDARGGNEAAAQRLIGLGNLAAIPAALTGASDWLDTEGAEKRVGLVHAAANYTALGLYTGSWVLRRRGNHGAGAVLAAVAGTVAGGAGWLGGHLVFAMGVGVDTTAFQQLPAEWTDAIGEQQVPPHAAVAAEVDGVPVLLARLHGTIVAMADRCTHRGAPLHEGEVRGDCIVCPWHDSAFALADGTVREGPATRRQPTLAVRVVDGRVQVRRPEEPRTLRTNPAGH